MLSMPSIHSRVLTLDDFAWLDEPAPTPPGVVKEPPVDQLLSEVDEGELSSSMAIPLVALPLFDKRTSTTDSQGHMLIGAGSCTSTKLIPRKGASAAWLDDIGDILSNQRLLQVTGEDQPPTHEQVSAALQDFPDELAAELLQTIQVPEYRPQALLNGKRMLACG